MSDYISRDAAKKILSCMLTDNAAECACNLVDCVFPADVEPARRWIPCSERMPETDGPYLVVNKATGWIGVYNFSRVKNFPYFGPQENAWWRLDDDWYPQSCNVTHWMPLPEPPEEKQNEDD